MTDHDALLRAVLECPDDDTPRLVYADYLDEHGEPERAEFVRVQVELARGDKSVCDRCGKGWKYVLKKSFPVGLGFCYLCNRDGPPWPDVKAAQELRARERELWTADAFPPAPGLTPTLTENYFGRLPDHQLALYRRGFAERITLPAAAFTPDLVRAVFALQPVTAVVLSDREPYGVFYPDTDRVPGSDFWRWWCFRNEADALDAYRPSLLPEPLYEILRKQHPFASRDAALAALSDACVAWARGLVGLPPVARAAGGRG